MCGKLPDCDWCKKEQSEPGALFLSPPDWPDWRSEIPQVSKFHICANCWKRIKEIIGQD